MVGSWVGRGGGKMEEEGWVGEGKIVGRMKDNEGNDGLE